MLQKILPYSEMLKKNAVWRQSFKNRMLLVNIMILSCRQRSGFINRVAVVYTLQYL